MSTFENLTPDQQRAIFWACFQAVVIAVVLGNIIYELIGYFFNRSIDWFLRRYAKKTRVYPR